MEMQEPTEGGIVSEEAKALPEYHGEVYKDVHNEWRWRLVATNGRIVATSSEGYVHEDFAGKMFIQIFGSAENVTLKYDG